MFVTKYQERYAIIKIVKGGVFPFTRKILKNRKNVLLIRKNIEKAEF